MSETETLPQYRMAAQHMLRDLMAVTVDELRQGNHLWHQLTHDEQDEALARIEKRVRQTILHALRNLSSAGFVRLAATLDRIAIKDDIQVTLRVARTDPARHELFDSGGEVVSVVLAEPDQFFGPHGFVAEGPQLELALQSALDSIAGQWKPEPPASDPKRPDDTSPDQPDRPPGQ